MTRLGKVIRIADRFIPKIASFGINKKRKTISILMGFINSAKRIVGNYSPRKDLILASMLGLGIALAGLLEFAPDRSVHGMGSANVSPINSSRQADLPALTSEPSLSVELSTDSESYWTQLEVASGDNLSAMFTKVGLDAQDMYKVLNSTEEAQVLNKLYPGYQLSFNIPEPGTLAQLKVLKSPLDGYVFTLNNDNYDVEPFKRTADIVPTFREGVINDSLFMAGQRADIPAVSIMEMADIFGGVIDFILDPRQGDSFSILYEEKFLDGEFIGNGEIIAAQFTNQGKQFIAVRYENEDGDVSYFNPQGESMRKAFLRTPLDVFRISSNFNLSRKHPILNTIRAHRGTDYAAPRGTPVRATADGVVTWAARNGSFGKLIVIQHNGQFETKYAHLNDYGQDIKKGARVKQGQVIGFVGTTGGSTGPHLHYEFVLNGVHKDPRTVLDQMPKAISIDPAEMPRFQAQIKDVLAKFMSYSDDSRLLSHNQGSQQ